MTIAKIRSLLYPLAKYLGDLQALTSKRKGAIPRRIGRRIIGKSNDEVEQEFTLGKRYEIVCGGLIDDEGDWRHDPWSAEFIIADGERHE